MQRMDETPRAAGTHFRNVVVGVDGHQGGRDAAALADRLAAADGSMTCVRVLVRDPLIGRGLDSGVDNGPPRAAQEPNLASDIATRQMGDRDPQVQTVDAPSVGRGLHDVVDAKRADLLVIGSCQRGLLGRVMIGDETNDALNGAGCAVAIAPFGYADASEAIETIGVAYDGSPDSINALAVGRELAHDSDARLSAFQAVAVPAYLTFPGAGGLAESVPEMVEKARARIAALGDVEPLAAYGLAAEELAVYSGSLGLLVIGSRGYGPIGRLIHGSTSRHLARTARCPLLVLPRVAGSSGHATTDDTQPISAAVA